MKISLVTGEVFTLREGESLYEALKRNSYYLIASCGGKGICGKCRVKIIEGRCDIKGHGKLTPSERERGFVLACQCYPLKDVSIEVPEDSRLIVGDKIAISKGRDLFELLLESSKDITPLVRTISLKLPEPSITDNISDLERIKRSLHENNLKGMRFSHSFIKELPQIVRKYGWDIDLIYTDCGYSCEERPSYEALFLRQKLDERYGIAIDIGTTTVVVYLINLNDGRVIDVGSTYNSQIRYGDDVITRIIYATEKKDGLEELRSAVCDDINAILNSMIERNGIPKDDIITASIAGNTTMTHIFWGLDPRYIREEPYIPVVNKFPLWKAGTARIDINPQAPLFTFPCVASYVGGDIVAGVIASGIYRKPELSLFMDIGTNGEIVIGNNEWLMTAACSAGPCFEGSGIKSGMRATKGAIESIIIDPRTYEPSFKVIGDAKPIGICGSGMIDALSEMFLKGVIDQKGKLKRGISQRIRSGEDGWEYVFHEDTINIVLTEPDIENIMRAKAAIYAGITLLLREAGLNIDAIERVYIAGGFGNYMDPLKAITIGMLPDIPEDRFVFLGNTSIAGAYLCLLSERMREEALKISEKMTYIELSISRSFMDEYLSALFLPHTDINRFPRVKELIGSTV